MSLKFVIHAYEKYGTDEQSEELDWEQMKQELAEYMDKFPEGKIEYALKETDHGIGADWPTVLIEIVEYAGMAFFVIPALHKKLRETLSEWKIIMQKIEKIVTWISKKKAIIVYPIETAFLKVLEHLERKTDILDLELVNATEIIGKADAIYKPSIENASLIYYLFILKEASERCYIVLIDSHLKFVFSHVLGLDPRFREKVEEIYYQK